MAQFANAVSSRLIPTTRRMKKRLAIGVIIAVGLLTILGAMLVSAAVTLDNHSGLEFTSGGVVYLGLELLEHEDGVGTIWLAIPKNHDLETGPVGVVIVLAPDEVTPVR